MTLEAGQPESIGSKLSPYRLPLVVDIGVILMLAVQWGSNTSRMDQLESQIKDMKQAQVTEARIVGIEKDVGRIAEKQEEANRLLREYISEMRSKDNR